MRQLPDFDTGSITQPESMQPPIGRPAGVCTDAAEASEVDQLIVHPHLRVETTLLRHVAEPGPVLGGDRPTVPLDGTRVRFRQPEDAAHGGGLAGAVGTEEANDPTAGNFEGGVVEGEQLSVLFRHAL